MSDLTGVFKIGADVIPHGCPFFRWDDKECRCGLIRHLGQINFIGKDECVSKPHDKCPLKPLVTRLHYESPPIKVPTHCGACPAFSNIGDGDERCMLDYDAPFDKKLTWTSRQETCLIRIAD